MSPSSIFALVFGKLKVDGNGRCGDKRWMNLREGRQEGVGSVDGRTPEEAQWVQNVGELMKSPFFAK